MKKVRWFVVTDSTFIHEKLMEVLAFSGDHQDIVAGQLIPVTDKRGEVLATEVQKYQAIKNLLANKKNFPPEKFEILFMPPGAARAGPWKLPKYFKRARPKKRACSSPQLNA